MTIIDKLKTPKGKTYVIYALLLGIMYQCTSNCTERNKFKREITSYTVAIDSSNQVINTLEIAIKDNADIINKLDKEVSVLNATLSATNKQNEQLININKKATHITISTENSKPNE